MTERKGVGGVSEWVSVKDRLPENFQTVLMARTDGTIYCHMYCENTQTDGCWVDDYLNWFSVYDVTHWMPLPEPPTEEYKPRHMREEIDNA